ncbi:Tyrosinase family protein asqI [Paramyrothecium foliicola]|nr:Tyrosinase family protein asqI [Paramyrothecium foliicola]
MKITSAAVLPLAVLQLVPAKPERRTVQLEPKMNNKPVSIETLSVPGNLDGFKIQASANKSSFDYWWFDLVSEKDDAALNVVFYNTGDIGNPQLLALLETEGAEIANSERGVSGHWKALGAKFSGTNLANPNVKYQLDINSPELGITGKMKLKSRAPAHYPSDPSVPGVTQLHMGRFFWSNAVPEADVEVNTVLKSAKFWDWGQSRVGPYSVVWYDLIDYVDIDQLAKDSVVTRPWGGNETYPPKSGLHGVDGVVSRFDLGDGDVLVVNVTKKLLTYSSPGAVYT